MVKSGAVIWFTGLSGSGKSTISERVYQNLRSLDLQTEYLDGDKVRSIFPSTGFTRLERHQHLTRIGYMASLLEKHGVIVIASFVSPFKESRESVRKMCHQFVEIYVSTPLAVCEKRDVKGLYAKARRGEIKNFTGISDPYEEPSQPDIQIDTSSISIDDAVNQVMAFLKKKNLIMEQL